MLRNKIIIIEKDINTINAISTLISALNFERIIFYNWNPKLKSYSRNEIACIFINVEIPMINVDKIINEYQAVPGEYQIPIFYIYKRSFSDAYKSALNLTHTSEIRKPFKLNDLYLLMDRFLNLDSIPLIQLALADKTDEFRNFSNEFHEWIDRFTPILESEVR